MILITSTGSAFAGGALAGGAFGLALNGGGGRSPGVVNAALTDGGALNPIPGSENQRCRVTSEF